MEPEYRILRARRRALDLTQGQVATVMGISREEICRFERGKCENRRPFSLKKLVQAYHRTLEVIESQQADSERAA